MYEDKAEARRIFPLTKESLLDLFPFERDLGLYLIALHLQCPEQLLRSHLFLLEGTPFLPVPRRCIQIK